MEPMEFSPIADTAYAGAAATTTTTLSCCPTVLAAVSSTLRSLSYLLIPTTIIGAGGHVPGTETGGGGSPKCRQSV